MQFQIDNHSVADVLTNFGHSVVRFAASAESDDTVMLCYDRDALLELGVMLLYFLQQHNKKALD